MWMVLTIAFEFVFGHYVAEQGRRFIVGEPVSLAVDGLIFPPIVSTRALLVATVLAVYKPWGRIRRRRAPKRDAQ